MTLRSLTLADMRDGKQQESMLKMHLWCLYNCFVVSKVMD